MSPASESVARGFAQAQSLTRAHARSFYFASFALWGERRRAAFALYAFCRKLDDMVDVEGVTPEEGARRIATARKVIASLYAERGETLPAVDPWSADELAAVQATVHRFKIPRGPFEDLVSGMEMDLTKKRYETFEELDLYCYRAAGTVGLLMSSVLGVVDSAALRPAADLGKAMQLTNILRDVREDFARGRVYLPSQELAAYGLSEADLAAGRVDDRFVAFMTFQVERAQALYRKGHEGLPAITSFGARTTVRLMSTVYGGILRAIIRAGFDVFSRRARVSFGEKLVLALKVLTSRSPAPTLSRSTP